MADGYFHLATRDRREALLIAAQHLDRPADLVEKDVYVVWALNALERAPWASDVIFKGGTSLSKAHRVIDRFSEDVDLTYDARALAPDVVGDGWPRSRSEADRWSRRLRDRIASWVTDVAAAHYRATAQADDVPLDVVADVSPQANRYDVWLTYPRDTDATTGYVKPSVKLEFGARGTGDPRTTHEIRADAAAVPQLQDVAFPTASVSVLAAERTFWEKATAAHVYVARQSARGDARTFARHWYDLHALYRAGIGARAIADQGLAHEVAAWKSLFFREPGVDFPAAVRGSLRLVPEGLSRTALAEDYAEMVQSGLLSPRAPTFDEVLTDCFELERAANSVAHR